MCRSFLCCTVLCPVSITATLMHRYKTDQANDCACSNHRGSLFLDTNCAHVFYATGLTLVSNTHCRCSSLAVPSRAVFCLNLALLVCCSPLTGTLALLLLL
eukprot:scpid110388/ scgid33669/ 